VTKAILAAAVAAVCLAVAVSGQPGLPPGSAAIYLKTGDLIVDRIVDISSARLVLQTGRNGEFPLRELWMINFLGREWNFPGERNLLESNEHYIFLKNGDAHSGRIVGFSPEEGAFGFASGEKFPIGEVRRIYFAKTVPRGLR